MAILRARQTDSSTQTGTGNAPASPTVGAQPAGAGPASDTATPPPPVTTPTRSPPPSSTTSTRTSLPSGETELGSFASTVRSDSTSLLPATTSSGLQPTDTSNSSGSIPTPEPQSGSRPNLPLIIAVTVLVALCLLAVVLAILTRRRRRRRLDNVINTKGAEFRSSSPDDDLFPVHFKSDSATSPARGEKLQMLHIRTHDLGSSDGLLSRASSSSTVRDSLGSSADSAELTPTQPTSLPGSSAPDSGSAAVERKFQASLAARARKMGIQPHQLLMLLTTSLDNQAGMSDVASSSDASSDRAFSVVSSDRAFSLSSVPPPYDHFAAVRRSQDVKQ